MGRVRKLVLKMPALKNTFIQLKNVQEWVNSNIHLKTNKQKKQLRETPTIFLYLICLNQTWEFQLFLQTKLTIVF